MNTEAKVITCKRKFDHVTPLLIELHWLPVRQRIVFKILLYTFKALHGVTPTYLTELISPYVPQRAHRSADQRLLEEPTHKLKSIGFRAFLECAPYLWNSLLFEIKSSASVPTFNYIHYITAAVGRAHIALTQTIATHYGPALPLLPLQRKVQSLAGLSTLYLSSACVVCLGDGALVVPRGASGGASEFGANG